MTNIHNISINFINNRVLSSHFRSSGHLNKGGKLVVRGSLVELINKKTIKLCKKTVFEKRWETAKDQEVTKQENGEGMSKRVQHQNKETRDGIFYIEPFSERQEFFCILGDNSDSFFQKFKQKSFKNFNFNLRGSMMK